MCQSSISEIHVILYGKEEKNVCINQLIKPVPYVVIYIVRYLIQTIYFPPIITIHQIRQTNYCISFSHQMEI